MAKESLNEYVLNDIKHVLTSIDDLPRGPKSLGLIKILKFSKKVLKEVEIQSDLATRKMSVVHTKLGSSKNIEALKRRRNI